MELTPVIDELFRHTPVGVVLCDLHGRILDVNDSLCAMVGYDRAELIGHELTEFIHPDDLADARARTIDLREGRTGSYVAHHRYRARDGRVVYAKVSVSIVFSKEGEPLCGITFLEDVTERVKVEEALRQSETRYRRVVDDQPDLIVRSLPDGTRTFVNEAYCRWHGAPASELLGASFFDRLPEEEQRFVRAKFAALSPSNPVITAQQWVVGPGGVRRWYEWTDRGFFDEEGRLVEVQSVGRDLTEEYHARQQLVESEERYRRLVNNLPVAVWENDWSTVAAELERRGLTSPEVMVAAVAKDPALYDELGTMVRVTTVNPAALAMAGVDTVREFDVWLAHSATPETALRFSQVVPALVFGDRVFAMDEYTLIRPNGEQIDVLIRIARSERW
ncbi:MAG TPA: PAS domain S-box protein, partial [Thermoanaerobaculia bacterium]|nr:PAS domain S-box protein [Thermoanaerobaculia bacterium]